MISERKLPHDLEKSLSSKPKAKAIWATLTPLAQRDFVRWVEGTKNPMTRKSRIERTNSMLISGKRRPCCYSVIPLDFYKALSDSSKAKVFWKVLTPDEKRDFADWVDKAKDKNEKGNRIAKACMLLANGKKRPL